MGWFYKVVKLVFRRFCDHCSVSEARGSALVGKKEEKGETGEAEEEL